MVPAVLRPPPPCPLLPSLLRTGAALEEDAADELEVRLDAMPLSDVDVRVITVVRGGAVESAPVGVWVTTEVWMIVVGGIDDCDTVEVITGAAAEVVVAGAALVTGAAVEGVVVAASVDDGVVADGAEVVSVMETGVVEGRTVDVSDVGALLALLALLAVAAEEGSVLVTAEVSDMLSAPMADRSSGGAAVR